MKKVKYEEMLLDEFKEALGKVPVAYIPCGLLEWHSSHLPLGIDGLKIEEMACRIAHKYGGIVLPPFYIGAPGYSSFQGTITYRPKTVQRVFMETFEQLIKVGFKVIVAIGGHYGPSQQTSLEKAKNKFKNRNDVEIWVLNEADVVNDIGILGDHAGPWETSMGMELCKDLVNLERFKPGAQAVEIYDIPQRPDSLSCESLKAAYDIKEDLKTCLDKNEIRKQVSIVVDRIGNHALELLDKNFRDAVHM